MDQKAVLLEILHTAGGETEYPISLLTRTHLHQADPEAVAERIARRSVNFCVEIDLAGWTRMYDADLAVPTAVAAAIGHSRGLDHAGYAFSTSYHKALIDLRYAAEHGKYAYDPELQALIERAARELGSVSGSGCDPLQCFDIDRE